MEVWKYIPGTHGRLMVSNTGKVRSFLRNKVSGSDLAASEDQKGYMRIHMTLDRERVSYKVHRLVADAFIPNPEHKEQVNHIDGNKTNNAVENLEWVTNSENMRHAVMAGMFDYSKNVLRAINEARKTPIIATNADTGETKRFESISDAERYFGSRHISDVLKGKRTMAAGHFFRHEEVMSNG